MSVEKSSIGYQRTRNGCGGILGYTHQLIQGLLSDKMENGLIELLLVLPFHDVATQFVNLLIVIRTKSQGFFLINKFGIPYLHLIFFFSLVRVCRDLIKLYFNQIYGLLNYFKDDMDTTVMPKSKACGKTFPYPDAVCKCSPVTVHQKMH